MRISTEKHGELSCDIEVDKAEDQYIGTLKYRFSEVGIVTGSAPRDVRAQFQAICEMVDAGGMVRHSIIMLGYHNGAFRGEVLLVDGEVIGEWTSDDEEWCHFTASGDVAITRSAPSPWMLHDSIAGWMKCGGDVD